MKIRLIPISVLLFTLSFIVFGCGKDEIELATVPDTIVEKSTIKEIILVSCI